MECYEKKLSPEEEKRIADAMAYIQSQARTAVGYPTNHHFDYSALYPFLSYSVNNVGDPFESTNYRLNTMEIEQEVIHFFAELLGYGVGPRQVIVKERRIVKYAP